MNELASSAAKIVFIILTLTACGAFLLERLPVDQFMILTMAAYSFYFSNKGDNKPYGGK